MAVYDLTQGVPSSIESGDILNCPYSGSFIALPLRKGTYDLECWGAMGGFRSSNTYAGKGGYSKGRLVLTSNTTLYLYAGGAGKTGGTNGGFNGGGMRYSYSGGGGGAGGSDRHNKSHLSAAGGGGGGSSYAKPDSCTNIVYKGGVRTGNGYIKLKLV